MFAHVNKVIFRGKRAVGVEYEVNGVRRTAWARKDVILSAGALDTPKLLMLSGVGPRDQLDKFRIPIVAELPGVGQRLQDQ